MAATYYAQLRNAWRWPEIARAIWAAIREAQARIEEFGLDSFPSDGVMVKTEGILANATLDTDDDTILGSVYLGHTYRDSPSGSFYAPWSAVPESVRDRDARWYEAFEKVAQHFGLTLMSGEGDPTDTYVMTVGPISDDALAAALMPDDIGAK